MDGGTPTRGGGTKIAIGIVIVTATMIVTITTED
jgi:hypothetical protein